MNNRSVDFYFTYLSPYAYLANSRIKKALEPFDVTLHYQTIAHMGSSDGPVFNETRYEYIVEEDVPRLASQYGLEFISRPPLTESYTASMGFLFAEEKGLGEEFNHLVFKSRWGQGNDISKLEVLDDIAQQAGLNRQEFQSAIKDSNYKQRLVELRQKAVENGVFGAPTFIYQGKRFWGNDRIESLIHEITREFA
ncbi:MAG: DsbA family protein [Gammaproteobacteria bacterium]|nr:DsbA family protein [Gammaproteobacteria bacterium]